MIRKCLHEFCASILSFGQRFQPFCGEQNAANGILGEAENHDEFTWISMGQKILKIVQIFWASPNTILGSFVGITGMIFGGKGRIRRGCLEFYGGLVAFLLRRTPIKAIAMTLGHSILGQTATDLDAARDHEHIHVQQYERWGPFFLPLYFWYSFVLWMQKKEAYRNNPFEKEAYEKTEIVFPDQDQEEN